MQPKAPRHRAPHDTNLSQIHNATTSESSYRLFYEFLDDVCSLCVSKMRISYDTCGSFYGLWAVLRSCMAVRVSSQSSNTRHYSTELE